MFEPSFLRHHHDVDTVAMRRSTFWLWKRTWSGGGVPRAATCGVNRNGSRDCRHQTEGDRRACEAMLPWWGRYRRALRV